MILLLGLAAPAAGADGPVGIAPPVPPPSAAPGPEATATVGGAASTPPPRSAGVALSLGVRTDLVRSQGFDAFSERDGLPQLSLGARYLHAPAASVGFALGASWDHGATSALARAASASLVTNRLSLTLEGRVPVARRFTALARLAPGVLWRSASLDDGGLPGAPYTTTGVGRAHELTTTLSVDASAGLEFLVGQLRTGTGVDLGLGLVADVGYSYSPSRDVVLSSSSSSPSSPDPGTARTDEPIRLGKLAVGGLFFRFAAALSFR